MRWLKNEKKNADLIETAKEYLKWEILFGEYNAKEMDKQAFHCEHMIYRNWDALTAMVGYVQAMDVLDRVSERYYKEIEKKVLRL